MLLGVMKHHKIVDNMHKATQKHHKVQKQLQHLEEQLEEQSLQLDLIIIKSTALKKRCDQQQKAEFASQSESLTTLKNELKWAQKKQFETKKHCDELLHLIQNVSTKASNTAQCLQIEIEHQKRVINEQANDQLKTEAEAKAFEDHQELNRREEQIVELKKLEQQNLSAESSELAKQLLSLQEVREVSLRDKKMEKDDNIAACIETYAEMERQKNMPPTTTIELQKDNETVTALQPVVAATSCQSSDKTIRKRGRRYRRTQFKHVVYQYNSDYNTDDDGVRLDSMSTKNDHLEKKWKYQLKSRASLAAL